MEFCEYDVRVQFKRTEQIEGIKFGPIRLEQGFLEEPPEGIIEWDIPTTQNLVWAADVIEE